MAPTPASQAVNPQEPPKMTLGVFLVSLGFVAAVGGLLAATVFAIDPVADNSKARRASYRARTKS